MRILFITQSFQPQPFLNGLGFAKELVKLGHSVQVLTGFPITPNGKVYEGYKIKFIQKEEIEGIPVTRVPLYPSHDTSSLRRICTYSSFALSASVIGVWAINKADVAYVYHPPATTCLPAWVIKLLRGVPFVYNIQDLWPDALLSSGMFKNRIGIWAVNKFCNTSYKLASKIVVESPGFKTELIRRGVKEEKIEIVYNWCDDTQIQPAEYDSALAKKNGMEGEFNILFAGGIGKGQRLLAVIEAANITKNTNPQIQFVFIGDGVELGLLKAKVKEYSLKNVIFLKRCPPSEIGNIMALAQVMLVHLSNNFLHKITIPSKIQAYLAVGKPILVAVDGDAAELAVQAGAGVKCEPENPEAIAATACKLYHMPQEELTAMGKKGQEYYNSKLCLKIGAKRYEDIFKQVAGNR